MKTMKELMALPMSGAALWTVHQWLTQRPGPGFVSAFDVLGGLAGSPKLSDVELSRALAAIASGDAEGRSLFEGLHALATLEHPDALGKFLVSLGLALETPTEKVRPAQ